MWIGWYQTVTVQQRSGVLTILSDVRSVHVKYACVCALPLPSLSLPSPCPSLEVGGASPQQRTQRTLRTHTQRRNNTGGTIKAAHREEQIILYRMICELLRFCFVFVCCPSFSVSFGLPGRCLGRPSFEFELNWKGEEERRGDTAEPN